MRTLLFTWVMIGLNYIAVAKDSTICPNSIDQTKEKTSVLNLFEIDLLTLKDTQIVTEQDLRFCEDQSLNYQEINPEILPDDGTVWRVGNRRWNDDWEKAYQRWVNENLTEDFFQKLNLSTDCADATVAVRAIFARMNNLPMQVLGGKLSFLDRKYSDLESVRVWNKESWEESYQQDKRFQAALDDWMSKIWSKNLHQDTYPIEFYNEENMSVGKNLAPGTIINSSIHVSMVVTKPEDLMSYKVISSTYPAKVRKLNTSPLRVVSVTEDEMNKLGKGSLWWNWDVMCKGKMVKIKDHKMPYHDDSPSLYKYTKDVATQSLENSDMSKEEFLVKAKQEIDILTTDIKRLISERPVEIDQAKHKSLRLKVSTIFKSINDVLFLENGIFRPNSGAEEDNNIGLVGVNNENIINSGMFEVLGLSEEEVIAYDTDSTPGRDKAIQSRFMLLNEILSLGWTMGADRELTEHAFRPLDEVAVTIDGEEVKYTDMAEVSMYPHMEFSSQPFATKSARWGLKAIKKRKNELAENANRYKQYLQAREKLDNAKSGEDVQQALDLMSSLRVQYWDVLRYQSEENQTK